MAPVLAILKGLFTIQSRDVRTLLGAGTNHFVLFAGLIFALQPAAGAFLPLLIGLLALIPASADPLRKLPAARRELWPLRPLARVGLRLGAWAASPIVWLAAGLALALRRRAVPYLLVLLAIAVVLQVIRAAGHRMPARAPLGDPLRWVPRLPGPLGRLVRKNVQELLRGLDVHLAFLLSLTGLVYRVLSPRPVPEACLGLSLLVVLALSTPAQRLFAFEGQDSFQRYRLWPLSGWQVLLAKDAAFLLILLLLVLPLAPLPGLGAGLVALALGQGPSVRDRTPQPPWTFARSGSLGMGILQVVGAFIAGNLAQHAGVGVLGGCGLLLLGGWAWGGWRLQSA